MKAAVVASVAINTTPLDFRGNLERVLSGLEAAKRASATLVVFPEMALTGYGTEDAFSWPETRERALASLDRIVSESGGVTVVVGLPLEHEGRLYSAACVVSDRKILGVVAKQNLARDGIHYEPRWFDPWPAGVIAEKEVLGTSIPFGDVVFPFEGGSLGVEICEDAWVSERPLESLLARGVTVIANPSASHFAFGKEERRKDLVLAASRRGVAYVYSNLLGNEAGRAIYDGDCLIAEGDEVLARSESLSLAEFVVTVAELGASRGTGRAGNGVESLRSKEVAFARAAALGLFDYARKSKSRGFVLSLSGGADSASIAVLVRFMVHRATRELGLREVAEKLLPGSSHATEEALMGELLRTAYQATKNSSEITRHAAASIARAVHSTHHEWSIEEVAESYRALAEGALGRSLSWEKDDLALQNIQARVRAPSVWLLANVSGALLLATSNRSESAVGYATMDGDTAGGLSPLSGIDKAFLREFLRVVEEKGLEGFAPIAELAEVNVQAPTAELRPLERAQTDEKDLMPYEILDFIERALVFERLPIRSIFERLVEVFGSRGGLGMERATLKLYLTRFLRHFARNQWKRERYAPSFHYDDENLDPRSWLRFPILSAGFEEAIEELP